MRRILLLAPVAVMVALAGCKHTCHKKKDGCCPQSSTGAASPILLPPTAVPTTPSASPFPPPAVTPAPSFSFPPPATTAPPIKGPEVLTPDPIPGNPSARPSQSGKPGFLGAPVNPTAEPPKAAGPTAELPNYTKVKDGLFAGGRPSIDGFDALKRANFRSVIFLHGAGADVNAVKKMAETRGLGFTAIQTTPETLADASRQFDGVAAGKASHPAYVFADDSMRAGAVWYLHFRGADALGDDVARLRAKPLGLDEVGEEGKAFAVAIQRVLETK